MKIFKISKRLKKENGVLRIVHEAMPLPEVDNYPHYVDQEGSLKQKLDQSIKDEIEDPEGKLDYFDQGSYGLVFSPQSDSKKVVKYTFDRTEIQAARKVWDYQKLWGTLPQHIVGLYDFGPVPNSEGVYRLVLEKVNSLSEEEQVIVGELYQIQMEYFLSDDPENDDYIQDTFNSLISEGEYSKKWKTFTNTPRSSEGKEKIRRLIRDYFNMGEWLMENGFTMDEAHSRNIGRRDNGDLVMLDYGMLSN
jgi:hypothetical protein